MHIPLPNEPQQPYLFDTIPIGLYRTAPDGRMLDGNQALVQMLGFPDKAALLRYDARDCYIDPEDLRRFQELVQRDGIILNYECRWRRFNGAPLWIQQSARAVPGADGQVLFVDGSAQDITQRKQAEEDRRQTESASRKASIGAMAGGITHEINQPLNAIRVTIDSMRLWNARNRGFIPDTLAAQLELIAEGVLRIDTIVTHIRSFWASPNRAQASSVDLNATVRSALGLIDRQLKHHAVTPELMLCPERTVVLGNRIHLEQMVMHLVTNALQALDTMHIPDKHIHISTHIAERNVLLDISDNGPGILENKLAHVFDPFYSTRTPGEHMGLGLAIVQQYVQEHGGHIRVQNNQHSGATFHIRLPLYTELT